MLAFCMSAPAMAQTDACTLVSTGTYQDITAFSVCKRVTNASGVTVCAVSNVDAAQWQSFYDYPPGGVSIANCPSGCTGYSYNGYCYHWNSDGDSLSCDAFCPNFGSGSCNEAGTRHIGSDDTSNARCTAVAGGITGTSVGIFGNAGGDMGCVMSSYKSGYIGSNNYGSATTCAASAVGRICACNI